MAKSGRNKTSCFSTFRQHFAGLFRSWKFIFIYLYTRTWWMFEEGFLLTFSTSTLKTKQVTQMARKKSCYCFHRFLNSFCYRFLSMCVYWRASSIVSSCLFNGDFCIRICNISETIRATHTLSTSRILVSSQSNRWPVVCWWVCSTDDSLFSLASRWCSFIRSSRDLFVWPT